MPNTTAKMDESLVEALPEFVAFVGRDGVVIRELGGRRLGLPSSGQLAGKSLTETWPAEVAAQLMQLIRRVLRDRSAGEVRFMLNHRCYEARVGAQGRERVLCAVREVPRATSAAPSEGARAGGRKALGRRAFHDRLSESIASATLRERSLAVCLLHLHGLNALGRVLDFSIVEQLEEALLARLPQGLGGCKWYVSPLSDHLLVAVIENFPSREALRNAAAHLCSSLAQPVALGDANFSVTPSAGLAVLGEDASEARALLEHARAAMQEARRPGAGGVHFYSDTLRMRSLARLDVERELRLAIVGDQLALRYAARHDLASGALVAAQAYLHWPHPLRGEVAAAEFLPIADSTGLAVPLSRWALHRWQRDLPALRAVGTPGMRFSFGPLRQHLSSGLLTVDLADVLQAGVAEPEELEIRIGEQALSGLTDPAATLKSLTDLGLAVVIDEFGRGATSLLRLARLPVQILQIERSLAVAATTDSVARRATAAALGIARSLELKPVAAGVDTEPTRQLLRELGCEQGLGDCFGSLVLLAQPEHSAHAASLGGV